MTYRLLLRFAWLLPLLLPTACDKQESVAPDSPQRAIRFEMPALGAAAEVRAAADLPAGFAFGVLGYCVPYDVTTVSGSNPQPDPDNASAIWENKKEFSHPDVFNGQLVTWNGTAAAYAPLRAWEENPEACYTFFAYHPTAHLTPVQRGNANALQANSVGAPRLRFEMGVADGATLTPAEVAALPDAMAAATYDVLRAGGKVRFAFRRLLAGLRFRINNYDTANPVTIHDIRVSGTFHRAAIFDFATAEPSATVEVGTYRAAFDLLDGDRTVQPNTSSVGTDAAGRPIDYVGETLRLLPAANLGSGITLRVEYTSAKGERKTVEKAFDEMLAIAPQRGSLYTFHLNFLGDRFVIMCVTDNNDYWDGFDNDVTIN